MAGTETGFGPGAYGASAAEAPGTPAFEGHGSGTVEISFGTGANAAEVTYELRVMEDPENDGTYALAGYVQTDGTVGAGEVWRTAAQWGATVEIGGLTDFVWYTVAARARNEMLAETAWSAESANMNTLPDIDDGAEGPNGALAAVGGDTKIIGDPTFSGEEIPAAEASQTVVTELTGIITVSYVLANYDSEVSSMDVDFSEDYDPENPGAATWATATSSGGSGKTGLSTDAAGKAKTFGWHSPQDAGASELKLECYLRFTPRDGDNAAGAIVIVGPIAINNRPEPPTWYEVGERAWTKDTTPIFEALMPYLRYGGPGFPTFEIDDLDAGTVLYAEFKSVEDQTGWSYQAEEDGEFVALTSAGIPAEAITGATKMRFELPAGSALAVDGSDNITNYLFHGRMGEVRDRG
jgi:hypothetical protein